MRRTLSIALLVIACTPALALPDDAEVRGILAERVDRYQKTVGIAVGLIDSAGRKIVAYGKTSRDDGRPVDGDTLFEIGSVTKVFTASVLADMAAKGEVALDDPVAKYLPEGVRVPARNGRSITLVDLATHTSGLPRMPSNFAPADPANPYADYTAERLYAFLGDYELTRDIGSQTEYSNLGAGLLGHALSRRAGTDYESLVRARITGPLGMRDTVIALSAAQRERLATGYDGALNPVANWDLAVLAGAGALRSTANDMLKFLAANLGFVEAAPVKALADTHAARHEFGPQMQIGLAWLIRRLEGGPIVWHNGGTGGYHSFVGFDPGARVGVVVLSNSAQDIDDIGMHLLDPAAPLAQIEPPPVPVTIDPAAFDAYAGRYQLGPGFVIEVSRDGGRYYVQATGQARVEIFPASPTEFFAKVVDARFRFERGESGTVDQLVLHQGGLDQRAKRVTGQGTAEFGPGKSVELGPELLERYVGHYELAPGVAITVTREGSQLRAEVTGQQAFEIYAESEREFFYKVVDARITFTVGSDGTVQGLTLHQGGRDVPARRLPQGGETP